MNTLISVTSVTMGRCGNMKLLFITNIGRCRAKIGVAPGAMKRLLDGGLTITIIAPGPTCQYDIKH